MGRPVYKGKAGRQVKALASEYLEHIEKPNAGQRTVAMLAARETVFLEDVDDGIMQLRGGTVNRGARRLHAVVKERNTIADGLVDRLASLGLLPDGKQQELHDAGALFAQGMALSMERYHEHVADASSEPRPSSNAYDAPPPAPMLALSPPPPSEPPAAAAPSAPEPPPVPPPVVVDMGNPRISMLPRERDERPSFEPPSRWHDVAADGTHTWSPLSPFFYRR
jgi:hypothetical protein